MKLEVTVSEAKELINQIQEQPEQLFEMIRTDVKQSVDHYLSELMNVELSEFLGRKPYERFKGLKNYRNGTYKRKYTLKRIGEVSTKIPRDRNGEFKTQVLPRRSRIDAPGALHHIIVRGIDRKTIFKSDADRDNFLERLKNILTYSET